MSETYVDTTPAGRDAGDHAGRDVRVPALLAGLGAAVALAALAWFVLSTPGGQQLDDRGMSTVVAGRDTRLAVLSVLGYVSIGGIALAAVVCVGLALLRGHARLALGAVVVIGGANLTTQVLKHGVLERATFDGGVWASNSLPSGHTTVVAAAAAALFLVSPRGLRVLVVPVGAFAVGLTGAGTVVAGWHRPADVVAALLVTLVWVAVVSLVVGGRHEPVPGAALMSVVGSAGALVLLVAIGVRPSYGWAGFVDASLVLGALGLAMGVLMAAMNRVAPTA